MKKLILTLVFIATGFVASAQVGIGTTDPDGILDVVSTDSGVILPRVASTAAVTAPIDGMMIYDVANSCIKAYEGGAWSACFSAGGAPVRNVQSITDSNYAILPTDDILIYTGSGPATWTFPTGTPLGKEYIIINDSASFDLLGLTPSATPGSNQLSAGSGTTVIYVGGDQFAALHSF